MKKTFFILLLIITGLLIFQSCKKCYQCTKTTMYERWEYDSIYGYGFMIKDDFDVCGKEYRALNKYSIDTLQTDTANYTVTMEIICNEIK